MYMCVFCCVVLHILKNKSIGCWSTSCWTRKLFFCGTSTHGYLPKNLCKNAPQKPKACVHSSSRTSYTFLLPHPVSGQLHRTKRLLSQCFLAAVESENCRCPWPPEARYLGSIYWILPQFCSLCTWAWEHWTRSARIRVGAWSQSKSLCKYCFTHKLSTCISKHYVSTQQLNRNIRRNDFGYFFFFLHSKKCLVKGWRGGGGWVRA